MYHDTRPLTRSSPLSYTVHDRIYDGLTSERSCKRITSLLPGAVIATTCLSQQRVAARRHQRQRVPALQTVSTIAITTIATTTTTANRIAEHLCGIHLRHHRRHPAVLHPNYLLRLAFTTLVHHHRHRLHRLHHRLHLHRRHHRHRHQRLHLRRRRHRFLSYPLLMKVIFCLMIMLRDPTLRPLCRLPCPW